MPPIRKLAFVVNARKQGAPELAASLIEIARARGVDVVMTDTFPIPANFLEGRDACCAIGGDGTLLSVVEPAIRAQTPVIGVNRGTLGFLTVFSPERARDEFPSLLEGDFQVTYRSVLECGHGNATELALNEVVIKESLFSRLISLDVFANDEWVTRFSCDGLIFSTPTGSTAYNLSAGGPISHPYAHVIAMTPICPHTLSNRTVIFDESVNLTVVNPMSDSHPLSVVMDGQRKLPLGSGEKLSISMSPLKLPLAHSFDYSHFSVLRSRLGWNGPERKAPEAGCDAQDREEDDHKHRR